MSKLIKHDGQWYDEQGNRRYVDELLSQAGEGATLTVQEATPIGAQLELFAETEYLSRFESDSEDALPDAGGARGSPGSASPAAALRGRTVRRRGGARGGHDEGGDDVDNDVFTVWL